MLNKSNSKRGWARAFADPSNRVDHDTGALNRFNPRPPSGVMFLKGTPKNEPFTMRHSITKIVASWEDSASLSGDFPLDIRVYTPSTRLRLKIVLAYEANDNSFDPEPYLNGGTGPTWVINAVSRNAETGRETLLKRAYPASVGALPTTTLPDAYEVDSAAEILQVVFEVSDSDIINIAGASRYNLVLTATWEPNTEIPQAELAMLYSLCSVVHNEIRTLGTTAP